MNRTQHFFIKLLGYYLAGKGALEAADTDWKDFCRLCRIHNVEGIAYAVLKKVNVPLPSNESALLKKGYFASICSSVLQERALLDFSQRADKESMPYMPFKGVVVRDVYPNPELRTMGDIDILVYPKDRSRCHAILMESGYVRFKKDSEWTYRNEKGVCIEIHDTLFYSTGSLKIDSRIFSDIWENTVSSGGLGCRRPKPEYHLIIMLFHMAKHMVDGFGVRMLLDVALWQKRYGGDLDACKMAELLNECGILQFSRHIFALCEDWFGVKAPVDIGRATEADICAELGELILENGAFGREHPLFLHYDRELAKKNLNSRTLKSTGGQTQFSRLRSVLFPPCSAMSKRYAYLKKRPFFLPAAWMQRGVGKFIHSPVKAFKITLGVLTGCRAKRLEEKVHKFGLQ